MMRYEGENANLVDQNPCAGIRADLKMCLLESDCVKKVIHFLFLGS
jgi:cytochrome c oxidase assembly factor 5